MYHMYIYRGAGSGLRHLLEVAAGPSWAIAEAVLNQTHIHFLHQRQRHLKGHIASW